MAARCCDLKRQFAAVNLLPDTADESPSGQYQTCLKAVNLLKRSQPAMLQRWTPLATEGDGNCLFRAVSQAVFGSQEYHSQLRLLACLEVGSHAAIHRLAAAASPRAHRAPLQSGAVPDGRPTSSSVRPRELRARGQVHQLPPAAHCLAGKVSGGEGCTLRRVPCCQAAQPSTQNGDIKGRRPHRASNAANCVKKMREEM